MPQLRSTDDDAGEVSSTMDDAKHLDPLRRWLTEDQIGTVPEQAQTWTKLGPLSTDERSDRKDLQLAEEFRSSLRRASRIVFGQPVMDLPQIPACIRRLGKAAHFVRATAIARFLFGWEVTGCDLLASKDFEFVRDFDLHLRFSEGLRVRPAAI